jgi:hypothetical protein
MRDGKGPGTIKRGIQHPGPTLMRKNDHLIEPFLAGLPKPKSKGRVCLVSFLLIAAAAALCAVIWV